MSRETSRRGKIKGGQRKERGKKEEAAHLLSRTRDGKLKIEEKAASVSRFIKRVDKIQGVGREGVARLGKVETSRLIPKQSLPPPPPSLSAKNNLCFSINVFQLPARSPGLFSPDWTKGPPPSPPPIDRGRERDIFLSVVYLINSRNTS